MAEIGTGPLSRVMVMRASVVVNITQVLIKTLERQQFGFRFDQIDVNMSFPDGRVRNTLELDMLVW